MDERRLARMLMILGLIGPAVACGDDGDGTESDGGMTVGSESGSEGAATSEGSGGSDAATLTGGGSSGGTTASTSATTTSATTDDTTSATTGEPVELVDVGHERELRAAWVATVYNINYPSSPGVDAATLEGELLEFLDVLEAYQLNAIVFQVRPESDAVYASELEPWSRFLSGAQGQAPDGELDPLAFLIEHAHARNIEVHAWFNPYRAKVDNGSAAVAPHISLAYPEHAHVYGSNLWMDPGAEEVREWVVDVIVDVAERYDVDGIHFDDYFYPYPNGQDFPDGATWAEYDGPLAKDDWRRDNVNQLVGQVHDELAQVRPDVRFGISPFGIYRPGMPEGIVGLDQYAELYSDPVEWIAQGWVDYLAPQLYWPSTQAPQAYGPLVEWWSELTAGGQGYIFVGNYLSKVGSEDKWSVDEFVTQLELTRAQRPNGALGNIYFQIEPLMTDAFGVATALHEGFYLEPALSPPLAVDVGATLDPPWVDDDGLTASLTAPDGPAALRAYAVYRDDGGTWTLDQILPFDTDSVELAPGTRWAISAVDRRGVESPGVVLDR